jgi:hypothetical protein
MASWEWSQWCIALLVVGNLVLAAHQHGRTRKVSRDVIHTGVAIALSTVLLTIAGGW